jgi:hypothetical protein
MHTVSLVLCPENYPRNLISFLFFVLSVWLTLKSFVSFRDSSRDYT